VVWLDPRQGLTPEQAATNISAALLDAGVDPDQTADLLLVPDPLDDVSLRRLYAAVDCVVAAPSLDALPSARKPRLTQLSRAAWRIAAGLAA
jgi:hypothetical protein